MSNPQRYARCLSGARPSGTHLACDGHTILSEHDGAGNLQQRLSHGPGIDGPLGTVTQVFDVAGNRSHIVHPDNKAFAEWRDWLGRITLIGEPYAPGSNNWIVTRYWYDNAGRRTTIVRGADLNGTATSFQYDAASRLTTIGHDLNGTANDLTLGFTWNPAGQIASSSRSNDAFAVASVAGTTTETPNGLNQLVGHDAATLTYDRRGNLTNDGAGTTCAYDSENRLVSRTANGATVALTYDPLGRLYSLTAGGATRRFLYDGHTLVSEHDNSAVPVLLQRYVHGPGIDEPVAYYQGTALGLVNNTYPHQDERGSIVAIAKCRRHAQREQSVRRIWRAGRRA